MDVFGKKLQLFCRIFSFCWEICSYSVVVLVKTGQPHQKTVKPNKNTYLYRP